MRRWDVYCNIEVLKECLISFHEPIGLLLGIEIWDLGMHMRYKEALGGHCIDRKDFVSRFRDARDKVREFAKKCEDPYENKFRESSFLHVVDFWMLLCV